MEQDRKSYTNTNEEIFKPEKVIIKEKIFVLVLVWLLITALLYWKWSDLAPEQFYLYFLYPFFSAYAIAGAWYNGWYLVTFKNTVGRPKFFLTVFAGIALLTLTIMVAEKGYGGITLVLFFFVSSISHTGLVVALYRNARKQIK